MFGWNIRKFQGRSFFIWRLRWKLWRLKEWETLSSEWTILRNFYIVNDVQKKTLNWINMLIFAAEVVDFFFFFLQERLYNIAILVINRNVMSVTNSIYCCVIFGTRMLHELITICLHNNYNSRMYLHKVEGLLTKKKRKKKKKNVITIRKEKQSLWNAVIKNLHISVVLFFFLDSSWNYRGQWVILHHRGGDRFNVLRLKRSFYPLFFFSIVLVLVLNGQSCDQVLLGLAYFSHWRSSAVKHFTLGEQASISKKKYCILVCNRDRIKFWNYFFFFVTFIDNEIRYCFFFYFFF